MTKLYNMYFNMKCNLKDKKGQGMVEYILIIALIGVVLIVTLTGVGDAIKAKFVEVQTAL
ncbi:MAG: Flp family type IVb pilin [Lutisporaceae bacterium]